MIEALVSDCRPMLDPMLSLLEELVGENSYSYHPEGGARVAEILARALREIPDLSVELVDGGSFAPHVVARSGAAKADAGGGVGLVGHHDTVFPPGTFEGFRIDGDIARGPGVLDMKGGLTVAIFALRALGNAGCLERLPVRFIIVSDEEVGSPHGKAVLERELAGAGCALVFEAGRSEDRIITQRKGTGGIKAIAHGRAAHAGNHHAEGQNAIWAMARFVEAVQRETDYERGVTVNVGKIQGGHSRNTVPDRCEALVDLRYLTTADGEAAMERLRACADEAAVDGARVELEGGLSRPPLERSAENVALFEEYAGCAMAAGLGGAECPLVGGGSDASTTAAIGVPSIDGLGPRGGGFHTHDEQIEVSSLPMRLEALIRFLHGRLPGS